MGWFKGIAVLVSIAMVALFGNILLNGSLDEGLGMDRFLAGLADPWTTFIGFDLMSGLALMACWIAYRELGGRLLDTVAWILCLTWWGNLVPALYIRVSLRQSDGDPARFLMGARAGALRPVWPATRAAPRLAALTAALSVAVFAAWKISLLGLGALAGQAYVPGFAPVVLAFILLAFPARQTP
jgi:hypothetical protein